MKPSFSIGAKNGLLEQKHLIALGQAIWLYLWFLDKQPKNTDKVLGGQPVTYQMFAKNFPGVPRRTYGLWLDKIKHGGYVTLLRTPKGYSVTINKPKKWVNSDVQKSEQHSNSDVQNPATDVQKSEHPMAEYGTSNIKETVKQTITNNKNIRALAPEHEQISKLYYQAIRANNLPILNHNTLRSKIKQMTTEVDYDKLKEYLIFVRDKYQTIDFPFKPHLNNALDIYSKRVQIQNAMTSAIKDQVKANSRVLHL